MHICFTFTIEGNYQLSPNFHIPLSKFGVRKRFKSQFCLLPKNCNSWLLLQGFQWHMTHKLPSPMKSIKSMTIPSSVLSGTWGGIRVLEGTLRLHLLLWFSNWLPWGPPSSGLPSPDSAQAAPLLFVFIIGIHCWMIKYHLQNIWDLLLIKTTAQVLPSQL